MPIFVPFILKIIACLNPLSAMILTMNLIGKFRAMDYHLEADNTNLEKENFTMSTGFVMLALDLILYTAIGFGIDFMKSRQNSIIKSKSLPTVIPENIQSDQSSIK